MKLNREKSGLTYIELMISSAVISLMVLGSINLMAKIYRYVNSSQMKSYATNLVSENLDLLRNHGFDGLPVTPDSCITNAALTDLSPLEANSPNNHVYQFYKTENVGAATFKIYSVVMYAADDGSGNVAGMKQSDLPTGNDKNLKQLSIVVNYTADNMIKTSRMSTLMSSRSIPMAGTTVSGYIYKQNANGSITAPGTDSAIHFVSYAGYTAPVDSTGKFTVTDVAPGTYSLYADGSGISTTAYGPLVTVQMNLAPVTGVTITCMAVDGGTVTGVAYIGVPLATLVASPTFTATYTPTHAITTKKMLATGLMTGKSQDWSSTTNIRTTDNNDSSAGWNWGSTQYLYTEFDNTSIANTAISNVRLMVNGNSGQYGNVTLNYAITKNGGAANGWANGSGGWSSTMTTIGSNVLTYNSNTNLLYSNDITSVNSPWDWTKASAIGIAFMVNPNLLNQANIESAWLEVDYYPVPAGTATFTPTNTPVSVATATPTSTWYYANGATVQSLDGNSAVATVTSYGSFTITAINISSPVTSVIALVKNNADNKIYYEYCSNVAVTAGGITPLTMYLSPVDGSSGSLQGFVKDSLGNALTGATVNIIDSTANTVVASQVTSTGVYVFSPVGINSWKVMASKPGYSNSASQTVNITGGVITKALDMVLTQASTISGTLTDALSGAPIGGTLVQASDGSGNPAGVDAYSDSVTGYYLITGIPVGSGYQVQPAIDTSAYTITAPSSGKWTNVKVGPAATNKNFTIKQTYNAIAGSVQMDGLGLNSGIAVLAYPSNVTWYAQDFRTDQAASYLQVHSGHSRVIYPYCGDIGQRDASYSMMVPIGQTYNVIAYYSFISYTGSPARPVKTLVNYYKKISNISAGATNANISGSLSSWTKYP